MVIICNFSCIPVGFTVLFVCCILSLTIALPQTGFNSDSELTERAKPRDVLVPIHSGAVIGEIVVGSGPVSVNRARPAPRRENEPSFSRFISEGSEPEVKFSSGPEVENKDSGKIPPKKIDGATIVFNNEAAIQEIV
ncbi:hypothetical protein Anas_01050 [Armadillidium nasatum]|uniref:Uncharacterized protein n=1 Tax=Armadillidium nasatum TaxID=96803 RepID=A0A5N5TQ17_9CRUS|nr:hypothetical protein Anas_01050 [Armadillidium nasatum]